METTPPRRLEALHDRRSTVRMSAYEQAYSTIVKKLRWALPMVALGILAVLMVWPRIQTELENIRFKVAPIDQKILEQAATENRLLDANFSSVDSEGRPFNVVAVQAVQQNNNPDKIQMVKPDGTLKTSDTETINLKGDRGLFEQDTQFLTLNDNVVMTRSDGTVMTTSVLYMDLKASNARTDKPLEINGPQGQLWAQGMTSTNRGALTVFTGPAKLILKNNPPATLKGKS